MLIGLIVGAVVGGAIGATAAYNIASSRGIDSWELVGWTVLGMLGGGLAGGAIGIGVGAAVPSIGTFLGSSYNLLSIASTFGESAAISATGAQLVSAGAVALGAFGMYTFSRNSNNNIPWHGKPNSTVGRGHSEGIYDGNGNLIYRRDYGSHNGWNPHTHMFKWDKINGVWDIIAKFILPF